MDQDGPDTRFGELDRQLAEQAAEVMRAFSPDRPKANVGLLSGLLSPAVSGLTEEQLFSWCVRNPALPSVVNVLEIVQVLERAGLVCDTWIDQGGTRHWSATQLGLAALAQGKDAVRQRILDRTGAASGMGRSTVTPPPRSIPQRLQELETLRATGVISDAEYTAKRAQIIDEI